MLVPTGRNFTTTQNADDPRPLSGEGRGGRCPGQRGRPAALAEEGLFSHWPGEPVLLRRHMNGRVCLHHG